MVSRWTEWSGLSYDGQVRQKWSKRLSTFVASGWFHYSWWNSEIRRETDTGAKRGAASWFEQLTGAFRRQLDDNLGPNFGSMNQLPDANDLVGGNTREERALAAIVKYESHHKGYVPSFSFELCSMIDEEWDQQHRSCEPATKQKTCEEIHEGSSDLLERIEQHFIISFFSHLYGYFYLFGVCCFGKLWTRF